MTYIGGELSVGMGNAEAHIRLGSAAGYIYGNAGSVGWWGGNAGAFQYFGGPNFPGRQQTGMAHRQPPQSDPVDRLRDVGRRSDSRSRRHAIRARHYVHQRRQTRYGPIPRQRRLVRRDVQLDPAGFVHAGWHRLPDPRADTRNGRSFEGARHDRMVLAALSTATVGQIVFEPRTLPRAGFLKANGVLVNRADYPALGPMRRPAARSSRTTNGATDAGAASPLATDRRRSASRSCAANSSGAGTTPAVSTKIARSAPGRTARTDCTATARARAKSGITCTRHGPTRRAGTVTASAIRA